MDKCITCKHLGTSVFNEYPPDCYICNYCNEENDYINYEKYNQGVTTMEYLVTWKIDIDAESPEEAAREAQKIMLDVDSIATVFEVTDEDGKETTVDLMGWL